MARRRGLRSRAENRRRRQGFPGWVGLLAGLAVGGLAVWGVFESGLLQGKPGGDGATSSSAAAEATPPAPAASKAREPRGDPARVAAAEAERERFEFYDMLPDAEVVVPSGDDRPAPAGPPPLDQPGAYVVQAGAFPDFAEADAVKARLALLGVSAEIQKVTVDERTFHRVRVGPIENLNELNRLRTRLRANHIDFLVIQVSE